MAPAQFKLAKRGSPTRRINFSTRPDWSMLSTKIATLFSIPNDNVAVSYVDADGDDITLSSDEELRDYYKTITPFPIPTIKFTVLDLRSQASSQIPVNSELPQGTASQPSPFRNTFGGPETFPMVFEVDDEWQSLPVNLGSLFLSKDNPDSPHAFVELLESEVSRSKHSSEPHLGDGDSLRSRSPSLELLHSTLEKGKERAYEGLQARVDDDDDDDDTSTGSIIGNEAPHKPPVHVFDVSDTDLFGRSTRSFAQSGAATPAQAQSTPVLSEQTLKDITPTLTQERASPFADDPPLPNVGPNAAAPSLTHDVATLLTTFSNVVTSHPELLESIHHIVSNSTNGTYWAAHREALSRAAGNIHRTAAAEAGRTIGELRRTAEEEAGARVAEALGSVFRTFSREAHTQGNRDTTTGDINTAQIPNSDEQPHIRSPDSAVPPAFHSPHSRRGDRRSSWFNFAHPPHQHHYRPAPFWAAYPPPPPPPPPPIAVPPIPPAPRSWPCPPSYRFWGRGGVDLNEPAPEARAPAAEAYTYSSGMAGVVRMASTPANENLPSINTQVPRSSGVDENLSPEELRSNLERAKTEYKLSKERYRKAKTIRKMSEHRHRDRHEASVER